MRDGIDFNIDPAVMDIVFDVMNFLDENREDITTQYSQVVALFLRNNKFEEDHVGEAFDDAFKEFVRSLLRWEIMKEFNMPEEKLDLLTEISFLDLLTEGYFFDKGNYEKNIRR